jgi:Uma2 family endonuclease
MSHALRTLPRMSAETYLADERESDMRHEFVDGVLYAMVGGTDRHGIIVGNLFAALHRALPDRCQVFSESIPMCSSPVTRPIARRCGANDRFC